MDTKWKNKYIVFIVAFFLTVGLCLFSYALTFTPSLPEQDFIESEMVAAYHSFYIEQYLENSKEDFIKADSINDELVAMYANYYGNIGDQLSDIANQYKVRIYNEKAEEKSNQDRLKNIQVLKEERAKKIQDIIDNHLEPEFTKKKIASELNAFLFQNKKLLLTKFQENNQYYESNFLYYIQVNSSEIYTNLSELSHEKNQKKIETVMNSKGVGSAQKITSKAVNISEIATVARDYEESPNSELLFQMLEYNSLNTNLECWYIPKEESDIAKLMAVSVHQAKIARALFGIGSCMLAAGLFLLLVFFRQPVFWKKIERNCQRIPIDLRMFGSIILFFVLFFSLWYFNSSGVFGDSIAGNMLIILFLYPIIFILLFLLKNLIGSFSENTEYPSYKIQFSKSLIAFCNQWILRSFFTPFRSIFYFLFILSSVLYISFFLLCLLYGFIGVKQIGLFLLFSFVYTIFLLLFTINTWNGRKKTKKIFTEANTILEQNQFKHFGDSNFEEIEKNMNMLSTIVSQSKESTRRNENLKAELLTNVSHDLRTPLTSILTYSDLLTKQGIDTKTRNEYIKIINQRAHRMKVLIDDLFEVTKMNNGEIQLNCSEVNLGQLLQQCLAEYSEEFEQRNLQLRYSKPSVSVVVSLDGDRIWRVFDNLFGNLVKYALEGTRIYLKLEQKEKEIVIQIKNVSKYELKSESKDLAERFKRGDASRHTDGSGLGLAIANSIIHLHGGELKIKVDGDLFKTTIQLPLHEKTSSP